MSCRQAYKVSTWHRPPEKKKVPGFRDSPIDYPTRPGSNKGNNQTVAMAFTSSTSKTLGSPKGDDPVEPNLLPDGSINGGQLATVQSERAKDWVIETIDIRPAGMVTPRPLESFGVSGRVENSRQKSQVKNPKFCKQLMNDLGRHTQFFEELWQASGSGTKDPREKGGVIGMDTSGNVLLGGIESPKSKRYFGVTYATSMGENFTKWATAQIQDQGKNAFAIAYTVHTHPVSGSHRPSGKELQDGSETGDMPAAAELGRDWL